MFTSRRSLFLFACLVSTVLLTGAVGAQKRQSAPKPTSGPTPVTASFRCPLGLDCYAPDRLDRIQGDSLGSYAANLAGSSNTANPGDLYLALQAYGGRFVSLDFTQPSGTPLCAAATTCQKNFTTVYTDALQPASITNPVDAMGTELPNGFLSISVGQSVHARFKLNFADPFGRSLLWTIRFNPTMYPGSGYVTVTRTSTTTWTVEATTLDPAELVSLTTGRGKSVEAQEGFYTMPFKITVTQ